MRGIDTTNRLSTGDNVFDIGFNIEPFDLFGGNGGPGGAHILDQIKEEDD
jgi:hypothetical protein